MLPGSFRSRLNPETWSRQVNASTLGAFRILFGLAMLWEVSRYFEYSKIEDYYIDPKFHFTYPLFGFIHPLPGNWMYLPFGLLGFSSLLVALGLFYRTGAIVFFLTYTYIFLIDAAQYNNHYYLICLLGFLLCITQTHRSFSIDALRSPADFPGRAPYWNLFIFQFQVLVVYFFGGIAKLSKDWLQGEPLRHWLDIESGIAFLDRFLTSDFGAYFFSYGGLLFDLGIGFLLLCRKTRIPAIVLILVFNLTNAYIFSIGIFPYLMIFTTVLFLEPETPGKFFQKFIRGNMPGENPEVSSAVPSKPSTAVILFLGFYCTYQVLFPLRHWLYPGDVNWTEEGHRFSWHMKLRDKWGEIGFFVFDPESKRERPWNMAKYLTPRQSMKMTIRPDMILQFAHFIGEQQRKKGVQDPSVRVLSRISLNFKPERPLIHPAVNLVKESFSPWFYNPWILSYEEAGRIHAPSSESHLDSEDNGPP